MRTCACERMHTRMCILLNIFTAKKEKKTLPKKQAAISRIIVL